MRRMELAGVLSAGRFFSGIASLQFASPSIAEELSRADSEQGIYWMNAADPASPAGLSIEGLDPRLPPRVGTARLCFRGQELIAVSTKSGKDISIFINADDPDMVSVTKFIIAPKQRKVHPEKKLVVEHINGQSAAACVYAAALKNAGFTEDRGKLMLW
jgi:ATP-dependent Lhr-like helicase